MDTPNSSRLHPVIWIAAVSVIVLCLVAVASIMGVLPGTHSEPAAPAASSLQGSPPPPTAQISAPPPPTAAPPASEPAPAKPAARPHTASKPQHKTTAPSYATQPPQPSEPSSPQVAECRNCGVIDSVRAATHEGSGSGLGAVAGGVLGGVLGHGVGQGTGRDIATVAGAVGGAVLGNKIEKGQRQTVSYEITVRFEDGSTRVLSSETRPAWQIGDKVRVVDGSIEPR